MQTKHYRKMIGRKARQPRKPEQESYPIQFESLADKRKRLGLCPDCGAARACYSCVTQGGWVSDTEEWERENLPPEP